MEPHGQRHTSAADDGRLRRFPDPPPPAHARDADALPRDEASLVRRRDELLWELYQEQVRLNMILRELVETEYAMAAHPAPASQWYVPSVPWSQGRWHREAATSVTTREDAPLRQPSTCPEHPPSCCCRSPLAVRPPPVYPHVERSPSPVSMNGSLEYCRSPSKQTLTKGALGPAMANASVRPMRSPFVRQEVATGNKYAVGGERKADLEEGHGVQPLFRGRNQSNGEGKAEATSMVDWPNEPGKLAGQDLPFTQQKQLESSEPCPEIDAKQQQERRSLSAMNGYLELCQLTSKRTRAEDTLVPAVSNASIRPTRSASREISAGDQLDIGGGGVENGHGMPLIYKIENLSSNQRKAEDSAVETQIDRPVQSSRGCMPAGFGDTTYHEQKGIDLSDRLLSVLTSPNNLPLIHPASEQPWPGRDTEREQQQECRSSGEMEHHMSGYVELCPSPRKQIPIDDTLVPVIANAVNRSALPPSLGEEMALEHRRKIGGEPKVDDVEDDHGVRPLYNNRNQSNDQRKVVESHMAARIDKPLQSHSEDNTAHKEFSEPTPVRISPALKRRLSAATPLPKKKKPLEETSSPLNHVDSTRQLHQSNVKVESLQARIKPTQPELNMKAMPGQGNSGRNWEPVRWDGKENVAEKKGSEDRLERWTCHICNTKCTSASNLKDHLGGRRHRERIEAILGEFRSSYRRMEAESGKGAYYCDICKVRCADDTVMASHLTWRKHRETLQQL